MSHTSLPQGTQVYLTFQGTLRLHYVQIGRPARMYTTIQKFGGSFFCVSKIDFCFSKHKLNYSKCDCEDCIILQMISVSNKCCSFVLSIHQSILKEVITVSTKSLNRTNQHIRMISERSRDTEN